MSNDEATRASAEAERGNEEGRNDQDGPQADELEKAGINPDALKDEKVKKAVVDGEEPKQEDGQGDEHSAAAAVLQRRYRSVVCPTS